ncbi:ADP compounds hydrolase NudE [Halomonas elongata]|uniref:ADP compounds hydrolase NudE n=1 Tax=Halomonas elongata TaxID=2746 RepID=A0A1B8P5Q3_HALEL|nr:ADP compounds hydrolase NudE [Halomonas elongata]
MADQYAKPHVLSRRSIATSRLFNIEEMELRFANGAERTFERLGGNVRGGGAVMIVAMPDPSMCC